MSCIIKKFSKKHVENIKNTILIRVGLQKLFIKSWVKNCWIRPALWDLFPALSRALFSTSHIAEFILYLYITENKPYYPDLWTNAVRSVSMCPHTQADTLTMCIFSHNCLNLPVDQIARLPPHPHTHTPLRSFGIATLDSSQTKWLVSHWQAGDLCLCLPAKALNLLPPCSHTPIPL